MKSIAFFNNKGGVGNTSLVYHLAWMFRETDRRIIAVDLDPQANLSGMFLSENKLEELWGMAKKTIDNDIAPLFEGEGDISKAPHIEEIEDRLGLLVGDLNLSKREGDLSEQWPKCLNRDKRAFRVTTAFARLIVDASKMFRADLALIDVGPNLGAINRAALIASDYVVMPLAPDLFSLQGMKNVGPALSDWKMEWKDRVERKPEDLDIILPEGNMKPLGYVVMRHSVTSNRPVKAYMRWIKKIPEEYRSTVLQESNPAVQAIETDEHLLAHLKDYRSLMPIAQEANKPMFMLKPADGVIGAQQNAVRGCYFDFSDLAKKIIQKLEEIG